MHHSSSFHFCLLCIYVGVAVKREVEGDLLCADIGQGLFFRPNSFDGAISISVIQWLCNADKREHVPQKRIKKFFQTLYNCLKRGARSEQSAVEATNRRDNSEGQMSATVAPSPLHCLYICLLLVCSSPPSSSLCPACRLSFQSRVPVLPGVPGADDHDHRGRDEVRFLGRSRRRLPQLDQGEEVRNTPDAT